MRLLLTDAQLIDGTGAPAQEGELLIEDDLIAAVGPSIDAGQVDQTISLDGAVVAPGFIDAHSHNDFLLPIEPHSKAKVHQGVTTEVVCNCGLGLAPANEQVEEMYRLFTPVIFGQGSGECSPSLDHYRDRLHEQGISVNAACLIPHGNVRCGAMGMKQASPSPADMQQMVDWVDEGMQQGAFGVSSGLVYPPGAYAETEELIHLAQAAARQGGVYSTHIRDEGTRLEESVAEAIQIAETSGASLQLSHHKASGSFNWGKVKDTLAIVDSARARGLSVHSDMYPYTAGSTVLSAIFVPLWVFEGGPEQTLARLKDKSLRPKIIKEAKEQLLSMVQLPGPLSLIPKKALLPALLHKMSDLIVISSVQHNHQYEGKSLKQLAKMRKQGLYEAMLDVLIEEELAVIAVAHVMSEKDVREVLTHPTTMVGSDGMPIRDGKPHPRAYGTYPRILEHYVKRNQLFTLEDAVHKMTKMVADKFGISQRGHLAVGKKADIVVFRPQQVKDRSTYSNPCQYPEGIEYVFVAGQAVISQGKHTGATPGRVLHRHDPHL